MFFIFKLWVKNVDVFQKPQGLKSECLMSDT